MRPTHARFGAMLKWALCVALLHARLPGAQCRSGPSASRSSARAVSSPRGGETFSHTPSLPYRTAADDGAAGNRYYARLRSTPQRGVTTDRGTKTSPADFNVLSPSDPKVLVGVAASAAAVTLLRGLAEAWTSPGAKPRRRSAAQQQQHQTILSPEELLRENDLISSGQFHAISAPAATRALQSSQTEGLSEATAYERRTTYGSNELVASARPSLLSMVAEQFEDRLVQILLGVAVISGIISFYEDSESAYVEPASILLILVLNAAVGVWQVRNQHPTNPLVGVGAVGVRLPCSVRP